MGVVSRAGSSSSDEMASNIRQNYHEECEALINKQINMEMYASYVYLSMACTSPAMTKLCTDLPSSSANPAMRREATPSCSWTIRTREAENAFSRTLPSQPGPSGAAPSRPLWQLSSSRRKSTRPSLTFTPLLERGTILIWLTTSKETLERTGGWHQRTERPDHQDEEGWRCPWTSPPRQRHGLNYHQSLHGLNQLQNLYIF